MKEVTGIWIRKLNLHGQPELLIEFGGSWHKVRIFSGSLTGRDNWPCSEIIEMHPDNFEKVKIEDKTND